MDFKVDELKNHLETITKDQIDSFTLINLGRRLRVSLSPEESFIFQKRKVEHEILQHILREEESENFSERLKETRNWLGLKNKKEIGFSCTFTGCTWTGEKHKEYFDHIKRIHFLNKNILCNYGKKCSARFSTVKDFEKHILEHHKKKQNDQSELSKKNNTKVALKFITPTRCNLCNKIFNSLKALMTHYNTKHFSERRPCIFKNCKSEFSPVSVSRLHFLNYHVRKGDLDLKEEFSLLEEASQIRHENLEDDINCNPGFETAAEEEKNKLEKSDDSDCGEKEDGDGDPILMESENENFLKALCDFYNQLSHNFMVPHSTVQFIAATFLNISIKSRVMMKKEMKRKLDDKIPDQAMSEALKVIENDSFIDAQQTLKTQYRRDQCLRENFKFIEPTEIVLNGDAVKTGAKKECFHYVNIIDSFRALIEDKNVIEAIEDSRSEQPLDDDLLSDIKDGFLYKNLEYFRHNPEALVGTFYSDAIEIVNPLGAGKGRQKVIQVFWSLTDIPKHLRSKVDVIQLALVVKESLVKKYGYPIIYKQLIEDMCKLEDGVEVEVPFRRKVKIGFPLHLGDNLECHSVGGFSTCFSSGNICRFCKIEHSQLQHNIHDYTDLGKHEYFTMEEYDKICDRIEAESFPVCQEVPLNDLENHLFDGMAETFPLIVNSVTNDNEDDEEQERIEDSQYYGIRNRCPFNKLEAFHATFSLPPDLLHDFLEGIFSYK